MESVTALIKFPQSTRQVFAALIFLVLCILQPTGAQTIQPLSVTNTRPVVYIHGIPASRQSQLLKSSELKFDVDYDVTNHFSYNFDSNETVRFDGETQRVSVSIKYGLTNETEIEIVLPYVSHDGGSLDGFIENWHDFFGFPQNGRTNTPRNQLNYFYEKNGVTKLDFQESSSGVGDAQFIYAVKLNQQWFSQQNHLTFKAAIKLPTGDSDKLTGSGGTGLAAWLAGDNSTTWFGYKGSYYYSMGGMLLEEGEVIPDQQLPYVLFGGIGSGAKLNQSVTLQLQLDAHTPLYEGSDMIELDSFAFLLTIGGNLKLGENWNLDIAVVEDILPHAAPDVTFHLGVNSRW